MVEKGTLERKQPKVAEAFGKLFQAPFVEGALPLKVKELIAICMALAVNCPECAKEHAEKALKAEPPKTSSRSFGSGFNVCWRSNLSKKQGNRRNVQRSY